MKGAKTLNFIPSVKKLVKRLPLLLQERLPAKIVVISIPSSKSRALNRQYRKKDRATSVLSFRYSDKYGEILVCPPVIRAEAKAQQHTFQYQMTWMIAHGMMHLSGLHHEKSREAGKRVARLEKKILQDLFQKSGSQHHHLA